MPSLKRAAAAARWFRRAGVTLAAALPLAGCTTTMHTAQRERLESARQRAALEATRVTLANLRVHAIAVAAIRSAGRTAFVVTVQNTGRGAVTDLPISVGYIDDGRTVYVNAGSNLKYFDAHLPAILPGRRMTWVDTFDHRIPVRARVFARVGRRPSAPALLTEPDVHIGFAIDHSGGRSLSLRVQNPTSVPQYELQVYAYALRSGRYVAAGNATVDDLQAGSSQRLRVSLIGVTTSQVHVEAIPTTLQ